MLFRTLIGLLDEFGIKLMDDMREDDPLRGCEGILNALLISPVVWGILCLIVGGILCLIHCLGLI